MASAFGHAALALGISRSSFKKKIPKRFLILAVVASILPDADVLGFKFHVPYGSIWGHRGITHSLFFAAILAGLIAFLFFNKNHRRIGIFFRLFLVTVSHSVLDAMTNGGLGVGFFIPFENSRYFFPFLPIEVSPIRTDRFFLQMEKILSNEMIWIGIPTLCLLLSYYLLRTLRRR